MKFTLYGEGDQFKVDDPLLKDGEKPDDAMIFRSLTYIPGESKTKKDEKGAE